MNIERLFASVKSHESFVAGVYKDKYGFDTFGYGTCVKDLNLNEDLAAIIMEMAIMKLSIKCFSRFDWLNKCPPGVQEVVVEMVYQIGMTGFMKFKKTIDHFKNARYTEAAAEMLDSKWASEDSPGRAMELSRKVKSAV